MDASRFDCWTRLFATSSRRSVLRSVGVGALAAALVPRLETEAACRKRTESCSATRPCCNDPGFNLRCKKRVCRCKKGFKDCDKAGGSCETNLRNDPDHCGKCAIACADTESCIHGTCTCTNGIANCPNGCVNCVARKQGGDPACTGAGFGDACNTDGDCPIGSVCTVIGLCSRPCTA